MVRNRFWNTTRGQVRALQTFTAAGSTKSSCAVITALRRPVCFIIRMIRSDGEKPILEYHSWSSPSAANVYGRGIDEILMRSDYSVTPTRVLYYQDDHEGSVTHLTDSSGAVIESYKYDAFGKPTINGGALTASAFGNRFMFTGREYVATFGVYEYRNRAYHPGLGRFMSEDPKLFDAGDNNFFRYCGNDPEDRTDPMGLSDVSLNAQKKIDSSNLSGAGLNWEKMMNMGAITVASLTAHKVEAKAQESAQDKQETAKTEPDHHHSWQAAGDAGVDKALPLATGDRGRREWAGDIYQSKRDPKDLVYETPRRTEYGSVADGASKPGTHNLSAFGIHKPPNGYKLVAGYWALPLRNYAKWPPGDRLRFYRGEL